MTDDEWHERLPNSYARVSWKTLAITSSGLAVSILAAHVIIITNARVDALASIALVLAILAFVIQIMVFIAQSFSSARRDREAFAVYADTQALLAKIEVKTNITNDVLNTQVNKMMDSFLINVKTTVEESAEDDGAEVMQIVLSELRTAREAFAQSTMSPAPRPRVQTDTPVRTSRTSMKEWPKETTLRALDRDGLNELSAPARSLLKRLAHDAVKSRGLDLPEGLKFDATEDLSPLHELKRLRFVRLHSELDGVVQLTGRGVAAARLFTAPTPIPAQVIEEFPWVVTERE